jgi:hypothetical protein
MEKYPSVRQTTRLQVLHHLLGLKDALYANLTQMDRLLYGLEEQLAIYIQHIAEHNADANPRPGSRPTASTPDRSESPVV